MQPLRVGQFALVDSEPVERGPNAGIFLGKGPADDRAELFVVAEGTTPAGDAFAAHVISAMGQAWGALDMSLTGALRRLFGDAEEKLVDWNRKSIAQHRVSIGMTCIARRGTQMVVAQAGPSVAFHLSGGVLKTYFADGVAGDPLGAGEHVEAQLTRLTFSGKDRLLLLSSSALTEMDDDLVGGILKLPAAQILPNLYRRVQSVRNLTAMLLTGDSSGAHALAAPTEDATVIGATAPASDPDAFVIGASAEADSRHEGYQPVLFVDTAEEDRLANALRQLTKIDTTSRSVVVAPGFDVEEAPEPLRKASGDELLTLMPALTPASLSPMVPFGPSLAARAFPLAIAAPGPVLLPAATARAVAAMTTVTLPARPGWHTATPAPQPASDAAETRRTIRQRKSFARGLAREEASPPPPIASAHGVPLVEDLAEERRARAATIVLPPIAEIAAAEAAATQARSAGPRVKVRSSSNGRWKGAGGGSGRTTTGGRLPRTWLVIAVGLGLLLLLVGGLTLPQLAQDDSAASYATLVDAAQRHIATSRVQPDPAERRKELAEAQALLLKAADDNSSGQVRTLINQVAGALQEMDAIRTPAGVEEVTSLKEFGEKPVAVARLVLGTNQAYVLDATTGGVIAMGLNGSAAKVVYSENREAKRPRAAAIAFMNSGELIPGGMLVIVDQGKGLWGLSTTGELRALTFAAPPSLHVTDVALAGRNLYVLDAPDSTVYRFDPGDGGFTVGPLKVVDSPDLAAARRIMVDGRSSIADIFTADANGAIRRFAGQVALVLSQAGIDERLNTAETPQVMAATGEVGILDASKNRIVVFRRDGTFERQYRHKDFQGMTAFAARDGKAYVFSGGSLRLVTW